MSFFFSTPVHKEAVDNKIKAVHHLLSTVEMSQKALFLKCLDQRINEFELELLSDEFTVSEKDMVLAQYERFAKTMHFCLEHPHLAAGSIRRYHQQAYYPVGIHDVTKPSPLSQKMAIGAVVTGVALLLSVIPAFIVNPIIGAICLSLSITLLLPSCFSLLIPNSPDTNKKKEEEKSLFQQGVSLIDPTIEFEDSTENHYFEPHFPQRAVY